MRCPRLLSPARLLWTEMTKPASSSVLSLSPSCPRAPAFLSWVSTWEWCRGPNGTCTSNCWRRCQIIFQNGERILRPPAAYKGSDAPRPHQHLLLGGFDSSQHPACDVASRWLDSPSSERYLLGALAHFKLGSSSFLH